MEDPHNPPRLQRDPLFTAILAQEHDRAQEAADRDGRHFNPRSSGRELSVEEERMLERE
jgi:hypothetical protein